MTQNNKLVELIEWINKGGADGSTPLMNVIAKANQLIQTSDSSVPVADNVEQSLKEINNVIIPKEIENVDWDEIKFEYTEYSQAQFDSGNDYLPLIEWLKQYFTLIKIK
jgi:hypothetical protein